MLRAQALSSIHTNPATALAAVPVAAVPVVYKSVRGSEQVTPAEQEEVRGRCCVSLCLWHLLCRRDAMP